MSDIAPYETNNITQNEYNAFQTAFNFFNAVLFGGTLPNVLITLQRHSKAYGFLAPEKFIGRSEQTATSELALNPDFFGRTDEEILSTLCHELTHLWQITHGKPPRRGYHDRQWAQKMIEIGLMPSNTGEPGGKQTGQHVSHYIVEGGPFALAFAKLQASGFALRWKSQNGDDGGEKRRKKLASKTKYSCPGCGLNVWAKPGVSVICGECRIEMEMS